MSGGYIIYLVGGLVGEVAVAHFQMHPWRLSDTNVGGGGGNEVNAVRLEARKDHYLPIHQPALTKPFGNDLNW